MSKDPAFLFYPNDYLGGTMGMTFEQKGAYIDLLIFQFNNHHFTEEQAKQVLSICFANAWQVLKNKFKKEGEFYFNERLRTEVDKRKAYTESRRINALHPKKPRKAYAKHMGNGNRNENRDINEVNKEQIIPDWIPKNTFLEYQNSRKKKIKTQSLNRFFNSLKKICDETRASPEDILNQSIVNGWEGIFPLKNGGNGNGSGNTRPGYSGSTGTAHAKTGNAQSDGTPWPADREY
ncbi:MAG: hypothetical protein WC926_05295 [Candidatus Paceibacterota bacterium]|jgi:uncharacterized protein YdaU (DUF1376 family)